MSEVESHEAEVELHEAAVDVESSSPEVEMQTERERTFGSAGPSGSGLRETVTGTDNGAGTGVSSVAPQQAEQMLEQQEAAAGSVHSQQRWLRRLVADAEEDEDETTRQALQDYEALNLNGDLTI